MAVQPPCGFFDYHNLNGSSSESFGFISASTADCISNRLQFAVSIVWICVFLLAFWCVTALLTRLVYKVRRWNASCSMIFLAVVEISGLLLMECGHFLGLRGYARMITHGLPMTLLVTGVSFVMMTWYRVVMAQHICGQDALNRNLTLGFIAFNICFHLFFWPPWLGSGHFEATNITVNNQLVGASTLWLGICGVFVGGCIIYLGRRIVVLLEETNQLTGSKRIEKIIRKVYRYSGVQSALWLSAGVGYIVLGAWGVNNAAGGVRYHYYITNFWLVPSMFLASLLLVYAGVNESARAQTAQTSAPVSAVPSSLTLTLGATALQYDTSSYDTDSKKSIEVVTP